MTSTEINATPTRTDPRLEKSGKSTHLVLIDGMSFIFRAFHAVRGNLSRTDGMPTNALYGFSQMLVRVVDDLAPTHCAMVLDSPSRGFRKDIYDKYKANRPKPPPELTVQLEMLEPLVKAFGLPILRENGFEADDLIATAVTHAYHSLPGATVTIVTSDKDLMQLVSQESDPIRVRLLDTFKDKFIHLPEVHEKFGVRPDQVIDVQSLMGDSSDNVPGVPGIGPKTATGLIVEHETLEHLYANLDKVKNERIRGLLAEHKDQAFVSKQLVTLKTDVALPPDHNLEFHPALHQAADFLRDTLEFRTLSKRLEQRAGSPKAGPHHAPPIDDDTSFVFGAKTDKDGEGKPTRTARTPFVPRTEHNVPDAAEALRTTPWGNLEQHGAALYECVTTPAQWQTWLEKIRKNGWAAFDTETTSLRPLEAALVGLSFATGPGEACYLPLMHGKLNTTSDLLSTATDAPEQLSTDTILADLKALLAENAVTLVAHNLKYDWQILAHALDISPENTGSKLQTLFSRYEDTMLLSASLDGGRWNHALDDLTARHLGHGMIPFTEVCGRGKSQVTFDAVPLDKATAYAAEDADATARLFLYFKERLVAEGKSITNAETGPSTVYQIEKNVLPVIIALETRGITLDVTALRALAEDLGGRLATLEAEVHGLAGTSFNLNSPKQLGEVLFDQLKLGTAAQQKKKGTGVDILEALAEDDRNPLSRQMADAMLQYRQLSKLKSTYAETLPGEVSPRTGRVHTTYHQVGAATGRFSSADPNLQNIPIRTEEGRKIRRAFIAPRGGAEPWQILSVDYSQIELRLLAHFSGSPKLTQAFAEGIDIHAFTAALVANKDLKDVTKEERRAAKFVNFGLVYGMGARALSYQIGCSVADAQNWISAYFQRYDGVKEYLDGTRTFARENGYVETLYGRRVWLPDINSSHGGLRSNAERAAINAPLQGSNADIIKKAMPAVEAFLQQEGLKAQTLLQVHDELVLEAPESELATLKQKLPAVMTGVTTLAVPLVVEAGTGSNWEDAH